MMDRFINTLERMAKEQGAQQAKEGTQVKPGEEKMAPPEK